MTLQPSTAKEVQEIVRYRTRVRVRGGGTKSQGTPDTLDMTHVAGITDYSPEECVFTARAGTRVLDIERTLAAHGQYLPFDPPLVMEGATIGGTVASAASGPGRYRYGGVRDFLIGMRIVDSQGRAIRSGGKVVKNAAGFLLHHGVVGSCGRFGVLTELTFKVFPAPEARRTLRTMCGSVAEAFRAARGIEQVRSDCEAIDFDEDGLLSVTVAGSRRAIEGRVDRVARALCGTEIQTEDELPPSARLQQLLRQRPDASSCIKVSGALDAWPLLQPHVDEALFTSAGRVAWLTTTAPDDLASSLEQAGRRGLVLTGPGAGTLVGHLADNPFEARVLQVLDPDGKFSATPHPDR